MLISSLSAMLIFVSPLLINCFTGSKPQILLCKMKWQHFCIVFILTFHTLSIRTQLFLSRLQYLPVPLVISLLSQAGKTFVAHKRRGPLTEQRKGYNLWTRNTVLPEFCDIKNKKELYIRQLNLAKV